MLIMIIAAAAAVAIVLAVLLGGKGADKNADFFTLGNDQIPSVKYVLGETRDISGFNS